MGNIIHAEPLFGKKHKKPQTLRPYQEQAIQACISAWERRVQDENMPDGARPVSPVLALATAAGKTTIFSELLRRVVNPEKQRALLLCDTEEIIYQMAERVENQFGELRDWYGPEFNPGIGIVMAGQNQANARILVATRQSLHPKRLQEVLRHGRFDYVIVDEAHGASPDNTYHVILQSLRQVNPEVRIAGFTATPKRSDRKALKAVFDEIAFTWSIKDGIEQGYLSPATRLRVGTQVDLSSVKTSEGDYNQSQLEERLTEGQWVEHAVEAFNQHLGATRNATLAFFPFVAMSQQFVSLLKQQGVPCAHVDGNTPKETRREIIRAYNQGELRLISNVMVFSKGFDAPRTDSILMARPTRSETLYTQIVGRGLRQHPGKRDCLIVELGVSDVKAMIAGDLLGRMNTCASCKQECFAGLKSCPNCGADLTALPKPEDEQPDPSGGLPRSFKATLSTEILALFDELAGAWWFDQATGTYSVSTGFEDGVLVIMPPNYLDVTRQRERVHSANARLHEFDPGDLPEVHEQMAMLRREVARAEEHVLFYAPKPPRNEEHGFPDYSRAKPVIQVSSNLDLASLMREGEMEAIKRGAGLNHQINKKAKWREQPASPAQVSYARRLGCKVPNEASGVVLGKGDISAMIDHAQAMKRVLKFIQDDILPEPEGGE